MLKKILEKIKKKLVEQRIRRRMRKETKKNEIMITIIGEEQNPKKKKNQE